MRKLLLVVLAATSLGCFAQKTDKKLTGKIEELFHGFHGRIGIYVHDLNKNKVAAINADSIFTTASMVKMGILTGIMDKLNKGEYRYDQLIEYKDSLLYPGSDMLGSFKNGEKIELGKVIMLMLTLSDNTASLWLQSLAGGGARINELMDSLGLKDFQVNSRTPGRQDNQRRYGWGQTTPYAMATLMEKIVKHQVISDSISERMLRLLGRNYWDTHAIAEIPSDVFVASKNGAVDASRGEVLFVNGRGRRYVFCICTSDNRDQSWGSDNEAWVLIRKVSKLLWEYYD
ncbi:MAG: serine hydrolase [Bacteroidetes bacterium]|nr:serine hydrolase [Bacteroidota bacterium]